MRIIERIIRTERRRSGADAGFTLIEVMVGFGLAALVFAILMAAVGTALTSELTTRRTQVGSALADRALEVARGFSYESLAMRSGSYAGDPRITTVGGTDVFDPGSGTEAVVASSSGAIDPHRADTAAPGLFGSLPRDVRVSIYVTWVDESRPGGHDYKRVVAIVEWPCSPLPAACTAGSGRVSTQRASTYVTRVPRGTSPGRLELSPGSTKTPSMTETSISFAHRITNRDLQDAFVPSVSQPAGWPAARYYRDSGTSTGVYDIADQPLGEDTGPLATDGYIDIVVVVGWATRGSGDVPVTLTVRSKSDPSVFTTAVDTVRFS
jgi:type II secretory pathway pseudopilin PulG